MGSRFAVLGERDGASQFVLDPRSGSVVFSDRAAADRLCAEASRALSDVSFVVVSVEALLSSRLPMGFAGRCTR